MHLSFFMYFCLQLDMHTYKFYIIVWYSYNLQQPMHGISQTTTSTSNTLLLPMMTSGNIHGQGRHSETNLFWLLALSDTEWNGRQWWCVMDGPTCHSFLKVQEKSITRSDANDIGNTVPSVQVLACILYRYLYTVRYWYMFVPVTPNGWSRNKHGWRRQAYIVGGCQGWYHSHYPMGVSWIVKIHCNPLIISMSSLLILILILIRIGLRRSEPPLP